MKSVGIIANDVELLNQFKEAECFSSVIFMNIDEIESVYVDILIIKDDLVSTLELNEKFESMKIEKCFYIMSDVHHSDLYESMIELKGIRLIPPDMTAKQVFQFVYKHLDHNYKAKSRVFTFFGADRKVGTTMIAQSVAESLVKVSDRVLFLPLDGHLGDDFVHINSQFGIGDLKSKLQTKVLTETEINELCLVAGSGISIMPGLRQILSRKMFHPEHISYLIDMLENMYEIIIIDAGSDIESGMCVAALNVTSNRFLVGTQQEIVKRRFSDLKSQILNRMNVYQFLLIINKYMEMNALDTPDKLSKHFDSALLTTLPFMKYGWQCELERHTLMSYGDEVYVNSIESVSKVIASHLSLTWPEKRRKSGRFIRGLMRRK